MTVKKFCIGFCIAWAIAAAIREARSAEFDTTDKVLYGTFIGLQVIDTAQTWRVHRHVDQYREMNPLYGSDPNMAVVVGVKALLVGGTYWVVRDMSSADRKLVLSVLDAVQLSIVGSNYSVGLKFGF